MGDLLHDILPLVMEYVTNYDVLSVRHTCKKLALYFGDDYWRRQCEQHYFLMKPCSTPGMSLLSSSSKSPLLCSPLLYWR